MLEILDITVPRAAIADYVEAVAAVEKEFDAWLPTYGHAADGNVHTHIMKAQFTDGEWVEIDGWEKTYHPIRDRLHERGKEFGGTVSGEHGIGIVKRDYLEGFVGAVQYNLMKRIKHAFDPSGIMNPGKVVR
jgi:glycolate oxidase